MPQETLHFANARQLSQLFNHDPKNLEEVERALEVRLASREDWVEVEGSSESVTRVKALFELLESARRQGIHIRNSDFHYTLRCVV